jgi:hypothetical protein
MDAGVLLDNDGLAQALEEQFAGLVAAGGRKVALMEPRFEERTFQKATRTAGSCMVRITRGAWAGVMRSTSLR